MASADDPGNIDDILKKAEAERFVGREHEIESFCRSINLTPPTYIIFSITGQGGVGKTALLNRYQAIARNEYGFLVAGCDEQQRDIPTVLGHFAQQLSAQNAPLKHFNERYKTYRQKMNEIENDPAAPQGLAALLGRTAVQVAFAGGDLVPGIRKGLELLPQDSLATQASEWTSYLAKKLTNKDDVALIRDPVPVLTPLFFTDLNMIAQKQKVLLCFENFEATRQELQQWLIHLGDYKASQNIRFVIAGRNEPGVQWSALSPITRTIRLDVLREPEAEKFLNVYGVTNPTRRAEILESSGRLPVIMSWLAAAEGNEPDISLPTHSIVERFLRWVDDPQLRQVALVGALPLTFNVDSLKLLLEHQDQPINEQRAFDWLLTMPFVKQRADGWYYHEVVRRMMMYYQRQRSPQSYRQKHAALADFYNQSRQELGLSEQEYWTNRQWRKDTLAYCYHYLLANPTKHWAEVITIFALAVRKRRTFSIELIEMLSLDDVQNELSDEQARVVQLFRRQLQVIREGNLQDGFAMFDTLCQMKDLSDEARGHMLAYRGECHRLNGKLEEALNDFNEALRYLPEDVRTLARRGTTFILLQRFEKALTDLNRAIALDAKDSWANAVRGEAYRRLGRYEEALADLNRAIALDAKDSWALAMRGETYRQMKRYEEALRDFNSVIALDEKYYWAIERREVTEHQMKLTQEEGKEEASRDSRYLPEPTIRNAPTPGWASASTDNGATGPGGIYIQAALDHLAAGRIEPAYASVQVAYVVEPNNALVHKIYGQVFARRQPPNPDLAIQAYNHSLQYNPNDTETHKLVGDVFLYLRKQPVQAIQPYIQSLRLNANDFEIHLRLAKCYESTNQLDAALREYQEGVRLLPPGFKGFQPHFDLGQLAFRLNQLPVAERALVQTLTLNPAFHEARYLLSQVYEREGRIADALRECSYYVQAVPGNQAAQAMLTRLRGWR